MDVPIICVPTEAGTHFAGQTKAPEVLIRDGHLVSRLEDFGYRVQIHDNVFSSKVLQQAAAWTPSPKKDGVRNQENTLRVMIGVFSYIDRLGSREITGPAFPIVIGGDCSITPAVFSALHSWHPPGTKLGLLYIDGDADLTLPSQSTGPGSSGILDSMTMTHLTSRPGGLESMKSFARNDGYPLINPENIVLFGFDPLQPLPEHWVYLLENGFKAFTRPTVQTNPISCARKALDWLKERVDVIYVHFDVDVIDSGEFPLANYPHYAGLGVDQALSVLEEVLSCPEVNGLTVTEINPNNDPDGTMVARIVEGVVQGMRRHTK